MQTFLRPLKAALKRHAPLLAKLGGLTLLTRPQTEDLLARRATTLLHDPGSLVDLPRLASFTTPAVILFDAETVPTATGCVYRLDQQAGPLYQLPNGSMRVDRQVLDLDFGTGAVLADLLRRPRRTRRVAPLLIAPWSHYWTGYFDFVFFIALKLHRIKCQLSPAEFAEAIVCYPLFHTRFEQEILALLGVDPANLVDSRQVQVAFTACVLGNNDSWFYPNRLDVLAFRDLVHRTLAGSPGGGKRLYIQRRGRRQVYNEPALLALLEELDFTVIADEPRSYLDQLTLYHQASFIIGPHGASFANLVACRAGTQLLELFASTYVPGYFRYLAHLLELPYAAYCPAPPRGSDHRHVADDVVIEVEVLAQQLRHLLAAGPA